MKCNRKKALPTGPELKEINDENILNAQKYLNFASRSMMVSVREKAGFGTERIRRFNEGHSSLGRGYVQEYAVEGEPREYAVDSYWATGRDIYRNGGVSPAMVQNMAIDLWNRRVRDA